MSHRSNSQLSTYARCGEQYRLEKIAQVPSPPAVYLIGGSAYHDALEWYEREKWLGGGVDHDQAVNIFLDSLIERTDQAYEEWPNDKEWRVAGRKTVARPDKEDLHVWAEQGAKWVREYCAHSDNAPWKIWTAPSGDPALELGFTITLGGVSIRGAIDAVLEFPSGDLVVRDYKTSQKPPSDKKQLGLYKLALNKLFGVTVSFGDYFMAREGGPTLPDDLAIYTEEMLTEFFQELDLGIRNKIYLPNPVDQNCRTCGVRSACRAWGGPDVETYLHFR